MFRVIGLTILGFFTTIGGFYIAYMYLKGEEQGSTPLLLLPAAILIGLGIFFLIKAGKTSVTGVAKAKNNPGGMEHTPHEGFADMLKRNNELESKWARTAQLKDQLKVLQLSAEDTGEDSTG